MYLTSSIVKHEPGILLGSKCLWQIALGMKGFKPKASNFERTFADKSTRFPSGSASCDNSGNRPVPRLKLKAAVQVELRLPRAARIA
jgi:hypothetical protein